MLEPGTLIGRYEIQRRLGRGGMGTVYVAHDPQLGRMVAIKFLRDEIEGPEALERFEREAKSAASLNHANVVTVHDFNSAEAEPYLVMEYVPGRTIADVIRKKEAVAIGEKLRWLEELCAGAGYAHRMSVVHRDIKPANLIIARSGQLKILDFGIARMMGNTSNTTSGIGTPAYMAPEQITGESVDHRADLFAIGVVCYELLSCREAFSGENTEAIKHNVLTRQPVPLSQVVANLHPDLIAIVELAIRKDRNQRYQDADSMRRALARVRQSLEADATQGLVPTLMAPSIAAGHPSDAGSGRPSGSPSQATPLTPHASRPRPDKEALARSALERSRTLFEQGNLDEALQQCHITLSIDEAHSEALAFEQTIQSALDQKEAQALIDEGRELVGRGALTEARGCLLRARALATDLEPVKRFQRELSHAEVELKRLNKRAETVAGMVRSAQVALAAGQYPGSPRIGSRGALARLDLRPRARGRARGRSASRGTGPMSPIRATWADQQAHDCEAAGVARVRAHGVSIIACHAATPADTGGGSAERCGIEEHGSPRSACLGTSCPRRYQLSAGTCRSIAAGRCNARAGLGAGRQGVDGVATARQGARGLGRRWSSRRWRGGRRATAPATGGGTAGHRRRRRGSLGNHYGHYAGERRERSGAGTSDDTHLAHASGRRLPDPAFGARLRTGTHHHRPSRAGWLRRRAGRAIHRADGRRVLHKALGSAGGDNGWNRAD